MSWNNVKPYFRSRMTALGYTKEHYDGFNVQNIASSTLHNTYFVELTTIDGLSNNQDCQHTNVGVKLQIFQAGYRKPREAIDTAIATAQTIVSDMIKSTNRLDEPNIHTVYFDRVGIVPIDESDDNSFILEIDFRCLVIFSTR